LSARREGRGVVLSGCQLDIKKEEGGRKKTAEAQTRACGGLVRGGETEKNEKRFSMPYRVLMFVVRRNRTDSSGLREDGPRGEGETKSSGKSQINGVRAKGEGRGTQQMDNH